MFHYRFPSREAIFLLLIQLIIIHRAQQIPLTRQDNANDLGQDATIASQLKSREIRLSQQDEAPMSPFIVLMSSDTISIAQLPMITNGNVSEIYRLSDEETPYIDGEHEQPSNGASEDAKVLEDSNRRRKQQQQPQQQQENEPNVNSREYEQMPSTAAVNTSMSLGKTEWQQIAAGQRDREEVLLPQQTAQANMNRKSARDEEEEGARDDDDGEGRQLGRPRKKRRIRRSNSSNDEKDSGSSYNNSGAHQLDSPTSDAQTSRRVNSAKESNAQNVTSAQSNVDEQQQQQLNLTLDGTRREEGGAPAEDGDKTSRSSHSSSSRISSSSSAPLTMAASSGNQPRFSDFDVHMALGYAFVADSVGRIHRFRLLSGSQSSLPNRGGGIVSNSENFPENDDANSIDAGGKFEFVSRQSKEVGINDSRLNFTTEATATTASNSVQIDVGNHDDFENLQRASENLNVVNKVGRRSKDVTHEQSGNDRQHPTISGGQSKPTSAASFAGSTTRDGSPISGDSQAVNHHQVNLDRDNLETCGAEPRIIWSRNKYTKARLSEIVTAKASSTKQREPLRQQLADVEGASSLAEDGNQMADELTTIRGAAKSQYQPHNQSGGGESQNDHTMDGPSGNDEQQLKALRTEIAVDWLNNLLFVLDKCRLLVMNFNGSNELVLIDDFNVNNRPIDIKVDPINDFLFWLQIGKFHNTIYKLDLSVLSMRSATEKLVSNALRLRHSMSVNGSDNGSSFDASDLIPLASHHYAHPIITNLPRQTKVFTIDHKHSRIYVPLVSAAANTDQSMTSSNADQSKRDDAEIFASTDDITHLNSTDTGASFSFDNGKNCNQSDMYARGVQILAYNLDGTDVGPFRSVGEESHINNLNKLQDLTLDSENNLLYWLTSDSQDLFEEYKDNATIQPAQHALDGRSYSKLIYFANNDFIQPTTLKSRSNVRKIINILSSSISSNRPTRSDGIDQIDENGLAISLKVRHSDSDTTRFARNAPAIILGITCLVVITIYLIYTLIFQHSTRPSSNNDAQGCEESLSGGSSIDESQADTNLNGFINSSTISKWIAGPTVRNRDMSSANGQLSAYDIESTNYDASNAIDEHYRDSMVNGNQSFTPNSDRLANLSIWPTNMHDRSNKLYVPVEVLQDDALSSIRRVSRDQLDFEEKAPLGQGHFGTVLQGTIKCTLHEKASLLDKSRMSVPCNAPISPDSLAPPQRSRVFAISSTSSGHGSSSSTSCEFTTANSCMGATDDDGYLTPKNQLNSASSDYCAEIPASSLRDDSFIGYCDTKISHPTNVETKLRVAIKKLNDRASLKDKRDFLQEAKLLANFDHPNIVHLIGICLDRGSTLIVMELMLGGDLIRYMQENKPNSINNSTDNLTTDDLLKVCLDIANGCCYLEDMDYIHRDLAARNCLVSSRKREERVVKLADFGLARDIYNDGYYTKLNESAMPIKWMAPECIEEQRFTKKSDVWSFGVVMWEVMSFCQEKPYEEVELMGYMLVHLAKGNRLRKPDNCDDNMYRLMNQCWEMEPDKRPTFHECRDTLYSIIKQLRNE